MEGTYWASLEPQALGEFSEGPEGPGSGAGAMHSSVGDPPWSGLGTQLRCLASRFCSCGSTEEGAPGCLPSPLLLREPKHTRSLLLSGARPLGSQRWENPRVPIPLQCLWSPGPPRGLHPAVSCRRTARRSPPRVPAPSRTDRGGEIRLSPAFKSIHKERQRQLLGSPVCNASD